MSGDDLHTSNGEQPRAGLDLGWHPARPRFRPVRLVVAWVVAAVAVVLAAWIAPGVTLTGFWSALAVSAAIGILNAIFPPVIAALRLPATLIVGFVALLLLNALIIKAAAGITDDMTVRDFPAAIVMALLVSAISMAIGVVVGIDDDDEYAFRVIRRVARRQGRVEQSTSPGLILLEIDGLGLPILQRAMADGSAPTLARWLRDDTHALMEWETDLSSQTAASQAGILLGSNADIPAFRWVEKERGVLMTSSSPDDCAEIERRHATGQGLLVDGGASRGNLLSGEADEAILTVSRMAGEMRPNPGYRSFLANGYNVNRALVLYVWEIVLEVLAAVRQRRRDVQPRGHRGGAYPFLRAVMTVLVRDLVVEAVLTDMLRGRPVVYATFASYDEVAHHSGLMRPDTAEALRKLDQQFGRIDRARAYAPRPYEIVVLSDHGQTQGATFKQRNGYGLDELVERSLSAGDVFGVEGGDESQSAPSRAVDEATGRTQKRAKAKNDVSDRDAVVLGSGNLGLVYLMDEPRRLTLEEIEARHPKLIPALREHPHVGWLLVRSSERGALALGPRGERRLETGEVEGEDPLAPFSPTAAQHLLRTDGFAHVADIMVGSFYDPELDEGCAFEELISFHGGLGGPQTRPFVLHPIDFPTPDEKVIGAEALHRLLVGWRRRLHGGPALGSGPPDVPTSDPTPAAPRSAPRPTAR